MNNEQLIKTSHAHYSFQCLQLPPQPNVGNPVMVSNGPVGTRRTTWYYYDGAFVFQADAASRPRCFNKSCFSRCAHVQAVKKEFGLGSETDVVRGEGEDAAATYFDADEGGATFDEGGADGAATYYDAEEGGGEGTALGATVVLEPPGPDDGGSPVPSFEPFRFPPTPLHLTAMDMLERGEHGLELHRELGLILRPPLPSQTCKCGSCYTDEGLQVVRSGCFVYMECPFYSRSGVKIVEQQCPNGCDECALRFEPDAVGLFEHTSQTFFDARLVSK
jgi:hypothetical protein